VLKVEKAERRSSALLPVWKPPMSTTSHTSAMVSSAPSKPHTSGSCASPGKPLCQAPLSDDIINISSDAMSDTGIDLKPESDSDSGGLASMRKRVSNSFKFVLVALTSPQGQPLLLTAAFTQFTTKSEPSKHTIIGVTKSRAPTLSAVSSNECSGLLLQGAQIRKASNSEIPDDCLLMWRKIYIPTLLQHLGTVSNPWDLSAFIDKAQEIYNKCLPSSPYNLTCKGDRRAQLVSSFFK